jgi:hypothetical protein
MGYTETDPFMQDLLPLDGLQNAVTTLTAAAKKRARAALWEGQLIAGLQLEWLSATGVRVKPGCAYVQGHGLISVGANIDKTGLSLLALGFYHLYLYNSGTVASPAAAVEVVSADPVGYCGPASQKTGDTSRRFMGSVRTDGSGNILAFKHVLPNFIRYLDNVSGSPNRVLTAGAATAETTVSCASVVPPTGRAAMFRAANTSNQNALFGSSEDGITLSGSSFIDAVTANWEKTIVLPLNASQSFTYLLGGVPASGGAYADCLGYWFDR